MHRRLLLLGVLLAACVFPEAAVGHGQRYEGYVSRVSSVEPLVPGLLVDVLGGDERLAVRNLTRSRVVFFDGRGRPVATVAPGGGASWHESRIHASGPPPERSQLVRRWQIRGTTEGRAFVVHGYLGYAAPPDESRRGPGVRHIVVIAALTALLVTALALPLVVRREGEGR